MVKYSRFSQLFAVVPLFLGGMILSFVLAISVWSVTQNQPLFQTRTRASADEVSLLLSPTKGTWQIGQNQTLDILLSTKDKVITGVDLTLDFDPTLVEVKNENIKPGNLLEKVLLKNVANNRISFSAVTANPSSKNGILVSITFKPLKKGISKIEFSPPNDVMEAQTAKNILGKMTSGQFDIQ